MAKSEKENLKADQREEGGIETKEEMKVKVSPEEPRAVAAAGEEQNNHIQMKKLIHGSDSNGGKANDKDEFSRRYILIPWRRRRPRLPPPRMPIWAAFKRIKTSPTAPRAGPHPDAAAPRWRRDGDGEVGEVKVKGKKKSLSERIKITLAPLQIIAITITLSCYAVLRVVNGDLFIGVGSYDMTGPDTDMNMMGYANMNQNTAGIHFRTTVLKDQDLPW